MDQFEDQKYLVKCTYFVCVNLKAKQSKISVLYNQFVKIKLVNIAIKI